MWRHALVPLAALCCTKGVDDGTRLAATGIIWEFDHVQYEIVVTATLGWKDKGVHGKNRSHKIESKGPHYAFVRESRYVGDSVFFRQLKKVHIMDLFRNGKPAALVTKSVLAREAVFVSSFLRRFDTSVENWHQVKLLKPSDLEKQESTMSFKARPVKRSRRLLDLERRQLTANMKQREQDAAKALAEAQRKAARLERQNRKREIAKEVKDTVHNAVVTQVAKMNKQIRKEIAKSATERDQKMDACEEKVDACEQKMDEFQKTKTDLDDLCGRLDHLQEETYRIQTLLSGMDKFKKAITKKYKLLPPPYVLLRSKRTDRVILILPLTNRCSQVGRLGIFLFPSQSERYDAALRTPPAPPIGTSGILAEPPPRVNLVNPMFLCTI